MNSTTNTNSQTAQIMAQERKPSKFYLYFVTITVNILTFTGGVAFAWTSPAIPKMNGLVEPENNPLSEPLTHSEESWIASLLALGTCVGPFVFGYLADKIGRKKTLIFSSLPVVTAFIIKAFAHDVTYFFAARFICGLGLGAVFTVIPMYVGEIAEDNNRGALGCIMPVFLTIGILFAYCVGPFLSIRWFCFINVIPPLTFIILMMVFVPNSPYFLIAQNKRSKAEISLRMFRGRPSLVEVDKEMAVIIENVQESYSQEGTSWDIFTVKGLRRGITITFGLMYFQQLSGISVLLAFMQSVFEAADSHLPSEIATIIIGFVQFFACAATPTVVDKLGRKFLLFISTLGTATANCTLGAYFYLQTNNYDVKAFSWLPIGCLILFMIAYNVGIGPLPWAMLGELFPPNQKARASTLTTFVCLFLAFFTNMAFPYVKTHVGMAETFWFFSINCIIGFIFVLAIVPETKGKSLHDIQVMLKS